MRIGQKLIHLESVDSTNNYAANLVKQGRLTSGTVILADEQVSGRGQRGTEWHAEPGKNLTFSLFVDEVNLSVNNQFILSQIIAVGIHDFLEKQGLNASIKWPNDVYINDKKIAGILIENQLSSSRPMRSIVGIGLNVNQCEFVDFNATSIQLETGVFHPLLDTLYSLADALEHSFHAVFSENFDINSRYMQLLYQYQQSCRYSDEKGEFMGEIVGISSIGKLQVLKSEEGIQEYSFKEIVFL